MNSFLRSMVGVASILVALFAMPAAAQGYPSKPIHIILPVPTGNAGDLIGRLVADQMSKNMKQPVVVENRPGAGGNIGTDYVAKSPADGYTVLFASSGVFTANEHLYKLPFNPRTDFIPVTLIFSGAPILAVNRESGPKTLQELIESARKQPGALSFASYGSGHISHILGEMFKSSARLDLLHVPYKSSPLTDVMAGRVSMIFESPGLVAANLDRLRPLATVGAKRDPKMPDVPALAEILPGFEVTGWMGAFVPAGTPPEIVNQLYQQISAVVKTPEFKKRLDGLMLNAGGNSPDEFAAYVRSMSDRIGDVIRTANIKLQ